MAVRGMLLASFEKYPDAKDSFEEELEIILVYLQSFKAAPFTLQRVCELLLGPEKYYRSTKKLLFAVEKLVNIGDPEEK
jgi:serine/threonine-protein phosphatase 4 regulatory subunit 2